ncbi:MAG: MBL fold metallo-hydrolase, partial [Paracoccus sp. (in: a-proteobacteria)]
MAERLIYLPLGGAGEIGMNAYVYGYGRPGKERLILVDLGLTFGDMETSPGVDLILPDITWLQQNRDRLEAIFVTHGHEDHIGAIAHLWGRLDVPIYARKFTGRLVRLKMEEAGLPAEAVNIVGPRPEVTQVGPFNVQYVPISHSIPESSALIIDTPAGRIVHTGDFKLDVTPVVGDAFNPMVWQEIGAEGDGVKVLACDSTNIFSTHPGRSEALLATPI